MSAVSLKFFLTALTTFMLRLILFRISNVRYQPSRSYLQVSPISFTYFLVLCQVLFTVRYVREQPTWKTVREVIWSFEEFSLQSFFLVPALLPLYFVRPCLWLAIRQGPTHLEARAWGQQLGQWGVSTAAHSAQVQEPVEVQVDVGTGAGDRGHPVVHHQAVLSQGTAPQGNCVPPVVVQRTRRVRADLKKKVEERVGSNINRTGRLSFRQREVEMLLHLMIFLASGTFISKHAGPCLYCWLNFSLLKL